MVYASLTDNGRRLLDSMQSVMLTARRTLCGGLAQAEMGQLTRLLEKARLGIYGQAEA